MKAFAVTRKRQAPAAQPMRAPVSRLSERRMDAQRAEIRHILYGPRLQAKLRVGAANDPLEREADRVADQVMRMPAPERVEETAVLRREEETAIQRQCTECEEKVRRQPIEEGTEEEELRRQPVEEEELEEEAVQAKASPGATPEVTPQFESGIQALRGGGRPLPESTRAFFEPRFGRDFNDVRVHTDAPVAETARAVNARAFTVGRDIVVGAGEYAPGTSSGTRLLAHELTHVVQQEGGTKIRQSKVTTPAVVATPTHRSLGFTGSGTNPWFDYSPGADREERPFEARPRETVMRAPELPEIGHGPTASVQRTATWAMGTERANWDAADRTINHFGVLGFTPPTLNGSIIMDAAAARRALNAPTWTGRSVVGNPPGSETECWFTANATNTVSYQLDVIDNGPHSVATTRGAVQATIARFAGAAAIPAQCMAPGPGLPTFKLLGQPDDASHATLTLAHERHHAADHLTEFNNVLVPWDTAIDASITANTVYTGPDVTTCEAGMWDAVGGTPNWIARNLFLAWVIANNNYHSSAAGKTPPPSNPQADAACNNVSMDHIR